MIHKVRSLQRTKAQLRRNGAVEPPPAPDFPTYWQARYPKYEYAPHVEILASKLSALRPGDALVINMPPRHGKSETVKAYLEWMLGKDPSTGVMFASYSGALANQASRQIRNEVQSGHAFTQHFPHVQLAPDAKKVQQWRLREGGGLIASGVGGSLTGMGARIGVIDDPLKGRQQAESLKIREGCVDWFRADFFTRLEPGGILIVIQTRWHKGDISGWIEENVKSGDFGDFNWDILNLPALAEDADDPLGRKPGEALWPGNWPADKLEKNRAILGEYDFASLYQQRPFLKGGSVFTDQVERFQPGEDLSGWRITLSADLAASIKTSADYSVLEALATEGKGAEMRGKVLEVRRGRFTVDEQIMHMLEMQEVYGAPWHVENSPNAIPVIQEARRRGVRIVTVRPVGDKYSRAMPYASAWNGGRVQVAFAPWAGTFIAEHTEFKGDMTHDHDDQVDASSQGWNIALKSGQGFAVRSDAAG